MLSVVISYVANTNMPYTNSQRYKIVLHLYCYQKQPKLHAYSFRKKNVYLVHGKFLYNDGSRGNPCNRFLLKLYIDVCVCVCVRDVDSCVNYQHPTHTHTHKHQGHHMEVSMWWPWITFSVAKC